MSNIEKVPQAPLVQTVSEPDGQLLMQARAIVNRDETLSGYFLQFKAESKPVEWLRDMLSLGLVPLMGLDVVFSDIQTVCQYLADEYHQLPEGYFLVNTETGKVVSVFTEDDLLDPGLLPRYSGEMAQALRIISPAKVVGIMNQEHESARDARNLTLLSERGKSTGIYKLEDDPRYRMATRAGRTTIARSLSEDDPRELLRRSGGTTGMFLRHFPVVDERPSHLDGLVLEGTASFRSQIGVQDALAMNLNYNRLGNLRSAAPQGWVREICHQFSDWLHKKVNAFPVSVDDLTESTLAQAELWVADSDAFREMKNVAPRAHIVPVEGALPFGLKSQVGQLWVEPAFAVESHERFNRWEVVANLKFALYLPSLDNVVVLPLVDLAVEAILS